MEYFDYQSVALEAKIPDSELQELIESIQREFPHDAMMSELHILRACMAIRDGHLTLEEALAGENLDARKRICFPDYSKIAPV